MCRSDSKTRESSDEEEARVARFAANAFPGSFTNMGESRTFSAEEFFAQQPPPKDLDRHLDEVGRFVEANLAKGRKVVLITVSLRRTSKLLSREHV